MEQIVIKKYRDEPCGRELGNNLFNYGISYTGPEGYKYSVQTTEESIWRMQEIFQQAGYQVIFQHPSVKG